MFTESAGRSVMNLLAMHVLCPGFADLSPAPFFFPSCGACKPALFALHSAGSRQKEYECVLLLPGGRTAQNPRWDALKKWDLLHCVVLFAFGM